MQLNEFEKVILLAFAENNMNVCDTASKLIYHRNTIDYQLKRIKKKTGLDPKRFYDLVKLINKIEGSDIE